MLSLPPRLDLKNKNFLAYRGAFRSWGGIIQLKKVYNISWIILYHKAGKATCCESARDFITGVQLLKRVKVRTGSFDKIPLRAIVPQVCAR